MIKFARSVGTAPGTTAIVSHSRGARALGICQQAPVPLPIQEEVHRNTAFTPHWALYDPYGTIPDLRQGQGQGLGIVLNPWEVIRTVSIKRPDLTPFDPLYNMRGEQGFYYDTRLGEIPTDAEFATQGGCTPVKSGWIAAEEGYIPPPWRGGWRPVAPQYGPPISLDGAAGQLGATAGHLGDVADQLEMHQRRMFYLSIFSTLAVVAVAITSIAKVLKDED